MKNQYICEDTLPHYLTEEAKEKANNDMAYKLAMALEREHERKAKEKDTA